MQFVVVFLVGLLVFLLMNGTRLGLRRMAKLYPGWNFRLNLLTAIEFIIWLGYVFWAINHLFHGKFFYNYLIFAILFIVFGFLSWFLLGDVFAGVIFKVKYNLRPGINIKTKDFVGIIKSQHVTHLRLKTDEGQILRVPYSRLNHLVISEMTHSETLEEHTIKVQVCSELSKADAEKILRDIIINTPWSNLKEEPLIKFIKETDKGYTVDIILFSTSLKHLKFIETAIDNFPSVKVVS